MAGRKLVASFFTVEQEFQSMQAAEVRAAAARCGFQIEVLDAKENAVLQIQQIFRLIHGPEDARPLAVILQTRVADGLERVARNAAAVGISWVLLNRNAGYFDALRRAYPRLALSSVTTDHEEIGRIQSLQFRALLPRGGRVVYVQGPADTAAAQGRLKGMQQGIRGAGIEVGVLPAEWTEESGEHAVTTWLKLKTTDLPPDIVGCQNDELAVGARRALRTQRPEWAKVPITGCDGLPGGGQQLVRSGELAATIVVASCAGPAVELLEKALATGVPPPPSLVLAPQSYPRTEDLRRS